MLQTPGKPLQKPVIKKGVEPPKKIIEPGVFLVGTLDDISRKLSELLISNGSIEKLNKAILKELTDEADEGEYLRREATANPNTFDILDFIAILGFPVKGYFIKNDGANTILHGHNITNLSIDSNINTADARFFSIYTTEESRIGYNRNKIKNIYLKSVTGNSAYRVKAVW